MARVKIEMKNNRQKTFDEAYDEFLRYCKVRNLRPATIKHYEDIVSYSFYKFLDYKFKTYKVETKSINFRLVEDYIIYCKEETNVKDITINTNLIGIRTILYYFMKLGYTEEFKITPLKIDKPIVETYTDIELKILLERPNMDKCNFLQYRNWVIVNFLIATGCRLTTLLNARMCDLDFENELITYKHTKNRKGQIIPMSDTLKTVLLEYIEFRQSTETEDYLFCTAYGKQITSNLLSQNLASYNRKRGVMKTGIHRFRHTFAKKWIMNGGDIFRLQKILGHSDMAIVKNYVEMFTDDLQRDFNEFNPLESIKVKDKFIKLK